MSAADLILSFLFTWSIGLAAPAIVRFAIYRRALLSSEAMAWAGSLGIGELILFSLLGSQSKTHAVLLLIGIVAYRILRRPSGRWDRHRSIVVPVTTATGTFQRHSKLDTPKKRLFALGVACWLSATAVLGILSLIEFNHAAGNRAQASIWGKRFQEITSKHCGHQVTGEKCPVGQTEYELFAMEATWESEHAALSELYLKLAAVTLVICPGLFAVFRWVTRGSVKAT